MIHLFISLKQEKHYPMDKSPKGYSCILDLYQTPEDLPTSADDRNNISDATMLRKLFEWLGLRTATLFEKRPDCVFTAKVIIFYSN